MTILYSDKYIIVRYGWFYAKKWTSSFFAKKPFVFHSSEEENNKNTDELKKTYQVLIVSFHSERLHEIRNVEVGEQVEDVLQLVYYGVVHGEFPVRDLGQVHRDVV